ncbi:MAG: deaminase, partial [Thermodesulfobacteriota bacterium]
DEIVATGRRVHSRGPVPSELDHAEIIALRDLEAAVSISTESRSRLWLYSTLEPCLMCMGAALISGIRNIVYAYEDIMGGACRLSLHSLTPLYAHADVTIVSGVMRSESIALFQAFFRNPESDYWKDSLLAQYTLSAA